MSYMVAPDIKGPCAICGTWTKLQCQGCVRGSKQEPPFYCGSTHQLEHWKSGGHKDECGHNTAVRQEQGPDGTVNFVATQPLKTGHLLFTKSPILVIPQPPSPDQMTMQYRNFCKFKMIPWEGDYVTDKFDVDELNLVITCLGCCEIILYGRKIKDPKRGMAMNMCKKCEWPLHWSDDEAPNECQKVHEKECKILTKNGLTWSVMKDDPGAFHYIGVLRAVQLEPAERQMIMNLPSLSEKFQSDMFRLYAHKDQFVQFIRKRCNLGEEIISVPDLELLIYKVFGNMMICNHGDGLFRARVANIVYKGGPIGQILPHSCSPNVEPYVDGVTKKATFRTICTVDTGEILTMSYDPGSLFHPMWERRDLLRNNLTICSCLRCSDPTENSTYFSSLKCSEHSPLQYLIPILNEDDDKFTWRCQAEGCKVTKDEATVRLLTMSLKAHMEELADKQDYDFMKKILFAEDQNPFLHPHHHLMWHFQLLSLQLAQFLILMEIQDSMALGCKLPAHLYLFHEKYLEDFQSGLNMLKRTARGRNLFQGSFLFHLSLMKMSKLAHEVHQCPLEFLGSLAKLDQDVKEIFDDLKEAWTVITLNPVTQKAYIEPKLLLRKVFGKDLIDTVTKHVITTDVLKEQVPNFVLFCRKYMANLKVPKE